MAFFLLAALIAQAGNAPRDLHETTRDPIGSGFVIEDERWERRGVPIMHVPGAWRKVRLVWVSPDGGVTMRVEDDGAVLTMGASVDAGVPGHPCLSSGGSPLRYDHLSGAERDRRAIYARLREQTRGCGPLYAAVVLRNRAAFRVAARHFGFATGAMRAAAVRAFGGVARRCIGYLSQGLILDPFAGPVCNRWSDPR